MDTNNLQDVLIIDKIYPKAKLKKILNEKFSTTFNTNVGVCIPKGLPTILLFVTENKKFSIPKSKQKNLLKGNTLYWEDQKKGTHGIDIIEHKKRDLVILVFFRKHSNEFPHSGFKYLGIFDYVMHRGTIPTRKFVLERNLNICYPSS